MQLFITLDGLRSSSGFNKDNFTKKATMLIVVFYYEREYALKMRGYSSFLYVND